MKRTKPMPDWMIKRKQQIRFRVLMFFVILIDIASLFYLMDRVTDYIMGAEVSDYPSAGFGQMAMLVANEPVVVVEEEEPVVVTEVNPEVKFTDAEVDELAHILYCEAGTVGSNYTLYLIGSIVLNRADYFKCSIHEVIWMDGQYSPTWNGSWEKYEPDERCMEIAEELLERWNDDGSTWLPGDVLFESNFVQGTIYCESDGIYFCYAE